MPAFANLASVTYFQRTNPRVSGRLLSTSVSSLSSLETKTCPYEESHSEGRRSSPTLPIDQSCQPDRRAPSTANIPRTSHVNTESPYRRTHAILHGQLITVVFPPGRRGSDDKVPETPRNMFADATIAVGARPLLHTAQGFPFDMRRSQVEASRVDGAPSESSWDLPASSSSRLTSMELSC